MDLYKIVVTVAIFTVMLVAAYYDLRWRLIPNALTYPTIIFGIVINWFMLGSDGLVSSLLGATVGFAFFFVFFALQLIGGGDVKLMASAGALLGIDPILPTLFWTSIAGALLSVVCLLRFRYTVADVKANRLIAANIITIDVNSENQKVSVSYGVAIGIGSIFTLIILII